MAKKVTLKDLAQELGVSQNTVSVALRGQPGISEATRKMILEAAKEKGYEKHFKKNHMPNICVLTTYKNNMDSYYFGRLQNRIEFYLNKKSDQTITVNNIETYSIEEVKELCVTNEIEGIILVADVGRHIMDQLYKLSIPVVCAGFYVPGMMADSILEDNVVGIELLIECLKSRGINSVGFIGSIRTDQGFFERWMAMMAITVKYGMEYKAEKSIIDLPYEEVCNQQKMYEIFSNFEEIPEAFVCANDKIAITAIKALQQNNIAVPKDVSIVGFDNCDVAQLSTPTVATVDNYLDEQAKSAVHRLFRRLEIPDLPYERILCPTAFVDGESLRKL